MNEKTPNQQTQSAMTEAREMARNRMPDLAESTVGVESFPSFTKPGRQRWESTVPSGSPGYILRFDIRTPKLVLVIGARHQREEAFH
jgi:hypothetical protein